MLDALNDDDGTNEGLLLRIIEFADDDADNGKKDNGFESGSENNIE